MNPDPDPKAPRGEAGLEPGSACAAATSSSAAAAASGACAAALAHAAVAAAHARAHVAATPPGSVPPAWTQPGTAQHMYAADHATVKHCTALPLENRNEVMRFRSACMRLGLSTCKCAWLTSLVRTPNQAAACS